MEQRPVLVRSVQKFRYDISIICFFLAMLPELQARTVSFSDITGSKKVKGLLIDGRSRFGHGVAFADISGDGLPDLYVSNAAEGSETYPEVLYISRSGKSYAEEADARGLSDNYGIGSHGLVFFDMDNDGDYDIYNGNTYQEPYGHAYNRLYKNDGQGNFSDVTRSVGLPKSDTGTRSVAAFDADNDGWMDLFSVGSKTTTYGREPYCFYINQANGTFKSADLGTAAMAEDGFGPNGLTIADYDNDGDQEIFISRVDRAQKGARAKNQLLDKQPDGTYIDKAASLNLLGAGWSDGATFADYDNDADLDLFISSSYEKKARKILIFKNNGDGTFTDKTDDYAIYQRGFSTLLFDADNDGDLDLYAISKDNVIEYNRLHLNDGHGNFSVAENSGLEVAYFDPRGVGVADIDNDGDLDLYVADTNKIDSTGYSNHLFRNDLATDNRWLKITGRGPKGDLGGFCSKIWIFEKNHMDDMNYLVGYKQIISNYGFCCQDDPVQHFGLAQRDTVAVKITMTDGTMLKRYKVAAQQKIKFTKPSTMEKAGGDQQTGTAGQPLSIPLQVVVKDAWQKTVAGAPVVFTATDGQIVEPQPVYTDNQGIARARFIVGTVATTQKIKVIMPLVPAAQLEFVATMIALPPVSNPNELQLNSPANPSGTAGSFLSDSVSVRVLLDNGLPCAGQTVQFEIVNGQGLLYPGGLTLLNLQTNSQGYAAVAWKLGSLPGSTTQQLNIRSTFQNLPLSGSPITISARAAFPDTLKLTAIDGDGQTGPVNGVLTLPLVVSLTNMAGTAVPNQQIRFKVTAGGGKVAESDSVTVITQANGYCRAYWRLGQNFRTEHKVTAGVVDKPDLQVVFTATGLAQASRLLYIGLPVYSGVVNKPLLDSLSVRATDDEANPVQGCRIFFNVKNGGGSVNGRDSVQVLTDAEGYAKCQWRLGPQSGTNNNIVFISSTGLHGSPVTVQASARPGDAYRMIKISGDEQTTAVRLTLAEPIVVAVTDSFFNPIPAVQITLTEEWPDAGRFTSTMMTNDFGQVLRLWTMGSQPGLYHLSVSCANLEPVIFSARAGQRSPASLHVVTGMNQSARPGMLLPLALVVQALDNWGEPAAGVGVRFSVVGGNGSTSPADIITSDSSGLAHVQWRLGDSAMQQVLAVIVGDESLTASFTANLLENHQPMIYCPLDTVCYEGQTLTFTVSATDADDDSLMFGADELPADAFFDVHTHRFDWSAGFQQSGTTLASFWVDDGHGGKSKAQVNIRVIDVPRPPSISRFSPQDSVIVLYQPWYLFSVETENPDGHVLSFSWWLNNNLLSVIGPELKWIPPAYTANPSYISVRISDGISMAEKKWRLEIRSSVHTDAAAPTEFALYQNYPNPFNPTTGINFSVAHATTVQIRIYDSAGKYIRTLTNAFYQTGNYHLQWDARDDRGQIAPSGLYLCRMECGDYKAGIKLLFMK